MAASEADSVAKAATASIDGLAIIEAQPPRTNGRTMSFAVAASLAVHMLGVLLLLPAPAESVGGGVQLEAISVDIVVVESPGAPASSASEASAGSAGADGQVVPREPTAQSEDDEKTPSAPPPLEHRAAASEPEPPKPAPPSEANETVPPAENSPAVSTSAMTPTSPAHTTEAPPPSPELEPLLPLPAPVVAREESGSPPVPQPSEAPPVPRLEPESTPASEPPTVKPVERAKPSTLASQQRETPAQKVSKPSAAASAASTASSVRNAQAATTAGPGAVAAFARRVAQALAKTPPRRISGTGTVQIAFTVGRNGGLERVAIRSSSGSRRLDTEVLAAVSRAQLPAPPAGASDRQRSFVIPYHFRRR